MKNAIVLCADDYGQAPAISQGIINLLQQDRLSATSCLVNSPYWVEHAQWLAPFRGRADLGLHFNLTEGQALSPAYRTRHGAEFKALPQVLFRALLHQFDQAAIEAECHAQIDQFVQALGCLPDHLDGHQHVHQFPVIRDAIINVYQQRLSTQRSYVRLVNIKPKFKDAVQDIKKVIIYWAGATAFKRLLEKNNIPHNKTFAGIYDFAADGQYAKRFPRFLQHLSASGIVMCHPGLATDSSIPDRIASARHEEYVYFASEDFINDCKLAEVSITRFNMIV